MEILDILKKVGAIMTDDHFVYTSGKHGSVYVNKDALYLHINEASEVGRLFAEKYKDLDIEVVVAPALGGIVLSQWTAYHLSKMKYKKILGVYTEKDSEGNQILTRGYDKLVAGKKVLIVEDITNTGGSVKKVMNSVRAVNADVVAVCTMINRNPEEVTSGTMGAPFSSLGIFKAEAFEESDCPLCKQNIPINTSVGHGKKYLAKKQNAGDR